MRISFLVFNLDGMGGTSRSAVTQADALADLAGGAGGHDVGLISITRTAETPHYAVDPRVRVDYLVDLRDPDRPVVPGLPSLSATTAHELQARESALVPGRWDRQFTALCDVALEQALPALDVDVLVTVTPGLLAAAVELTRDDVVVVHQEHRSTSDRTSGLEPLLAYAPRADVVASLTTANDDWLRERLGALAPPTVVMPNPLPLGFTPRSALDASLITTGGRLVAEKQFPRLVDSFAEIADRIPAWRLRICGDGPQRVELVRQIRKWDLWDRVELPGSVPDMAAEWARASVAALTSRAEGFPLVVQEAMAAGVPVASYDCPSGPREIIDHEVNGLLVGPQSVSGMAAALLRLTTDDELRRRLGRGALRTSRSYDAHALAERWVAIFTDARARRGGRGRLAARGALPANAHGAHDPNIADAAALDGGVTPAAARHGVLDLAVATARAVTDTWLVIPAHEGPHPTVVVPMPRRAAYLRALAAAGHPPWLCLRDPAANGWPERRGPVAVLAGVLARGMTNQIDLEPWPLSGGPVGGAASLLGTGCTVAVQFWEVSVEGDLIAPDRNAYADRIRPAALADAREVEIDGVACRSLPVMIAPTASECRFPVDVVYTWVDGGDPAWDRSRQEQLTMLTGVGGADAAVTTRASSGRARYLDRGELRYSLRSIDLFAPWVRRIHIVTAGQTPAWLDASHPRIDLVDHRDLLPPEALPTFNSHAIETSLHRIEGLAEHWVYLNDDVLLGRAMRPEAFFTASGLTRVPFSHTAVGVDLPPDAAPYLTAAHRNRALLQQTFGAVLTRHLAHAPYAHRTSVLEDLWAHYPDELAATAHSPFRGGTDVSALSSLAQHFALLSGRAVEAPTEIAFVNLANADVAAQLRRARARAQDSLCLADHHDHALDAARLQRLLTDFLEAYYPIRAPWELPSVP